MGCGCRGASGNSWYLVTVGNGDRSLVGSEPAARLLLAIGGGGVYREVTEIEAAALRTEGVKDG